MPFGFACAESFTKCFETDHICIGECWPRNRGKRFISEFEEEHFSHETSSFPKATPIIADALVREEETIALRSGNRQRPQTYI